MNKNQRILTIDAMRGITLFLMLFVNEFVCSGGFGMAYASPGQLRWDGTCQLGVPRFFIYGWLGCAVCIAGSFEKRGFHFETLSSYNYSYN